MPQPALYPRLLQFGHIAIPTYGVFNALALVAALAAAMHFARRLQLNANKLWNLGLIAILTTLIASRLLLVTAHLRAFRMHPFWVLGLLMSRAAWIFPVAVLIGIAAASLYVLAEGLPFLRTLDCIAPCAAIALILNRTGAFLAGADHGLLASNALGVTYTSHLAALWYGTPLRLRLYPIQLYEALVSLALLGLLVWWLPRRTQDGEMAGAFLFIFGAAGFFLSFYCDIGVRRLFLYQFIFALMVVASAAFLIRRKPQGYTEKDDSPHV